MTGSARPSPVGEGAVAFEAEGRAELRHEQHYRAGRLVRWLVPAGDGRAADLTVVLPAAAFGEAGAPVGDGTAARPAQGVAGAADAPTAGGLAPRIVLRAADGRSRDLLGLTHGWRGEVVATPAAGGRRGGASFGGVLLDTPVGDVGFVLALDPDGGVRTAYTAADSPLCRSCDLSLVAPWAEVVRWLHDDERILGHLVVEGWPFDGDLFVLSMVEGVLCAPDAGSAPRLPPRAVALAGAVGRARADWVGRAPPPEETAGAR